MRRSPANDSRTSARTTGVAANEASSTPSSVSHCAPGSASVAVRTTIVPPPAATPCTPGSSVSASSAPSGDHRQTWIDVASSIGLAVNTMPGPSTVATARTCRSGGVTGSPSTSSRRAPSRSAHVTERPVGRDGRHARHELDPRLVVRPRRRSSVAPGRPGRRGAPRAARWSRRCTVMIRPASLQCTSARYGKLCAVPLDVDDRAVEADDVQRDVGVGGAGGRVRQLGRRGRRVGRVAEVPALHGRRVDAGDGEGRAVGAPPEAAVAVHLLGGDEVGAAPRDRLGLVGIAAGEEAPAPVELADAQQAAADVGDARASGSGRGSNTGPATGSSRAWPLISPPTNSRPPMANAVTVTSASVAKAVMPPADSRVRSRRARSSGGRSSSSRPEQVVGVGDEALLAGGRRRRPTGS